MTMCDHSEKSIAIYAGCFNPPTVAHLAMARILAKNFDSVIVVPCSRTFEKNAVTFISTVHRAAMVDLTFRGISDNVEVDLFDLDEEHYTPSSKLIKHYHHLGNVWIVVGSDKVSEIRNEWIEGNWLWNNCRIAIFDRKPYTIPPSHELPPHHRLFPEVGDQSCEKVRELVFLHQPYANDVVGAVHEYIEAFALYRGVPPPATMPFALPEVRALILYDERNPRACACAEALKAAGMVCSENPNVVAVIGGDGTMIRAIFQHWRLRLPFFGINCGHVGHLLNDITDEEVPALRGCHLLLHHLPLLHVEVTSPDGEVSSRMGFNDTWIERSTGQTAWLELSVNGEVKIARLVGDGLLISTAAGSTAYAHAMGLSPIPSTTPVMCMIGNNVAYPLGWKPVYLPLDCSVTAVTLDVSKRPVKAFVDGVDMGPCKTIRIRVSNIADCRLAFLRDKDMLRKLQILQFPGSSLGDAFSKAPRSGSALQESCGCVSSAKT